MHSYYYCDCNRYSSKYSSHRYVLCRQGNVQFVTDGESVLVEPEGGAAVGHIAQLTSTEAEGVAKALLFRTVATGGGDVIEKGHTKQEAYFGRDAFSKVSQSVSQSVSQG